MEIDPLRGAKPMFTIVPEDVWILSNSVGDVRREALLSTSYEDIVSGILSQSTIGRIQCERNSEPVLGHLPGSLKRYRFEIRLPCDIVDRFHNGAGGYRAQFYESEELGEEANDYCRDKMVYLIKSRETEIDRDWMTQLAAISLHCHTTKIWIGQGLWYRLKYKNLRNLHVPRWRYDPKTADRDRKKRWLESMLVPDEEKRINLIGGWLRCSDQKLVGKNPKPQRSQHIHCFGFT